MDFIDRKRELKAFHQIYYSNKAELVILFGRRRIGKTRLITHFCKTEKIDTPFYWMATTHNNAYQLRDFSQAIYRFDSRFSTPPPPTFSFADWEAAFIHLADIAENRQSPTLFVLDEFTYLLRNDPAITSILQKVWDHRLSQILQFKFVLTGSLVGMMQKEIFAYQAPLYGRATSKIRLRPLPYAALIELFPERSVTERIAIYAVTGGVPAYLELFTRDSSFSQTLKSTCFEIGSLFLSDPALILNEQLSEPQTYESILSAVAWGFHQWKEIAQMAGVSETSLAHYLHILQELELIERRDPIFANPQGKQGRYHLCDPFLRFYYRFIVPNLASIERGYLTAVVDKITAELRPYIGVNIFEGLCQEWIWSAAILGELPFSPEIVGSYWRREKGQGVQLDVVAANPRQKQLLIGECKWGSGLVPESVLSDLIERSQRMPEVAKGWKTHYLLFAREGFTPELHQLAKERDVQLISAEMLENSLIQTLQ